MPTNWNKPLEARAILYIETPDKNMIRLNFNRLFNATITHSDMCVAVQLEGACEVEDLGASNEKQLTWEDILKGVKNI